MFHQHSTRRNSYFGLGWVNLATLVLLLSIIGTTSVLLVRFVETEPSSTALVINEAGRQRMRVQRMVRESLLVAVATTAPEREVHRRLLGDLREEWRRVHDGLQNGSAGLGLPVADRATREVFDSLVPRIQRLDGAVAQILAPAPDGARLGRELLLLVQSEADSYVEGMEPVVLHFQRLAEARERRFRLVQTGALMAPLLFSLAALLILWQSSLRIRRAYERLTDAHAQLKSEIQQRERSEADRQRLAVAVTQAEESIVITDVNGVVQYVNPAFERHTGYGWNEIVGLNQRILKSGKQDAEFYRRLWSTIRGGKVWRGRIVNRRKDGQSFVEQQTISPVRDENGTVVNFIGIKQDITRAEQLERQLGHARRLEEIGRTAGGIAHNFNNLLTPILGYSEMLAARLDPATPEREYIDKVLANVHRARDLISQIQIFGRKSEPVRKVFGLDEVVREEADQLRSTLPPNVTLHIELPGAPALVHADPSQIHSVVLNLAVNAVHAMPDGGHLWLRVGLAVLDNEKEEPGAPHSGLCVRLEVEDTGTGIAAEVLPHIFEPFFTTKGADLGTGLGLATALSIVHQHGGDIAVDSEPGRGTRFRVHLPASDYAPEQPLSKEDPEYRGGGTVLVVDDEEPIVEFCRAALEQYGYQVDGYSRPYAALRRFARDPQRYRSVVVDQSMPGLNGHQLVGYFRRKRPNLPCIVISGHHDALPPDEAHTRLCVHLAKPFTPRELVRQVASIIDVSSPRPADAPSSECTR